MSVGITVKQLAVGASIALCVLVSDVVAQDAPQKRGYLDPSEFDVTKVIEPAPRKGDPRYDTDRAIFRATRALKDSPRWQLAISDAEYNTPALLKDFSCAVGVRLTPQDAPKVTSILDRATLDTSRQSGKAKAIYQRERPFLIDHGPTCEPPANLYDNTNKRMSFDYPSGHSTKGWTFALVLSAIAPDDAQRIMERGRAYADSRFVCGSHNESAVEAGMFSASATMALVSTKPAYQSDLAAARSELQSLRAGGGPAPENCAAEAALVAQRVMPQLTETAAAK
jgi:acid phosphatase (class A)